MTDARVESFKMYSDMAKQVLTLSSGLLVAVVGAVKGFSDTFVVDFWIGSAVILLVVSIFSGVLLMGALIGNIQGGSDIKAPEIRMTGRVQHLSFFLACSALAAGIFF